MAKGYGQKELITKQRDMESSSKEKLPVKVGSIVEFLETPEFNGFVKRISKDQWQTVYIDYGVEGKSKFLNGDEFMGMVSKGKIVIISK